MKFDRSKYKFFNAGNKIIAVSTYAGKIVRGFAVCDPRDTFDEKKDRDLAAAKCNEKVARKRLRRAQQKLEEAEKIMDDAEQHYFKMKRYAQDSYEALTEAENEVTDLLSEM